MRRGCRTNPPEGVPATARRERPTVFVVDDDPSVRKGLSRLIRAAGFRVETFPSADAFIKREPFDGNGCMILDIRMPGMTGPELQDVLNRKAYTLPILFLTGHGDVPSSVRALKRGAVDFFPKPVDQQDLLAAIQGALDRDRQQRNAHRHAARIGSLVKTLTPREHEVMRCVIGGMLNKQIAGALGIAEKTVKIHRGRVMRKMQAASVPQLVRACETAGIPPISRAP